MFFHKKKQIFTKFPVVLKGFPKFSALRANFFKIIKIMTSFIKKNRKSEFFFDYFCFKELINLILLFCLFFKNIFYCIFSFPLFFNFHISLLK